MQHLPKSDGSSERSSEKSSKWLKKESSQQSERSGSERSEDSRESSQQRARAKYGSRPPEYVSSDAEVSQWILKAEEEDRRLAAAERAEKRRIRAEELQLYGLGPPPVKRPDPEVHLLYHRGCKYRLPSTDPIPIPTIPYDPLDKRWLHQEQRRRRGCLVKGAPNKAPKKNIKALCELADAGFDVPLFNDLDDDSDDSEFEDPLVCPICSNFPEIVTEEIEITDDQVIKMAVDQVFKVAVDKKIGVMGDSEIEVAEDVVTIISPTDPAPKVSTTMDKIKSYVQNILKFRRTIV